MQYHEEGMNPSAKQAFIHRIALKNPSDPEQRQILWSRHAINELTNEGWRRDIVETALQTCEIIEDYPAQYRPLPDCLVLGRSPSGVPIHAVVAVDESNERLLVITVYRPSSKEWLHDWRTRKN